MEQERDFKGIWIPKEIWLSNELTLQEKVILVEIDSLDNDEGCFASNKYFADFFNLSTSRISQIINGLQFKKWINVEYKTKEKQIVKRVIKINKPLYPGGIKYSKEGIKYPKEGIKYPKGGIKYSKEGYLENCEDNNIYNNNIINNIINNIDNKKEKNIKKERHKYGDYGNVLFTDEQYEKLKKEFPDDYEKRIQNVDDYVQSTGKKYKDYLATIRTWARRDKQKKTNNNSTGNIFFDILREEGKM